MSFSRRNPDQKWEQVEGGFFDVIDNRFIMFKGIQRITRRGVPRILIDQMPIDDPEHTYSQCVNFSHEGAKKVEQLFSKQPDHPEIQEAIRGLIIYKNYRNL